MTAKSRDGGVGRLLWAWITTLVASGVIVVVANSRSRYECNVGASTTGCETTDYVVWLLLVGVPGLAVLLGLVLLLTLATDQRRRGTR